MPLERTARLSFKWWSWLIILLIISLIISLIGAWVQLNYYHTWNSRSRINLVLINHNQGSNLQIFSYENQSPELTKEPNAVIVDFPPDVKFQIAYGYGQYLSSVLYDLSSQEQNKDILVQTIQRELGIPIDGWLVSGVDRCTPDHLPGCLPPHFIWWSPYLPETNLNRGDILRLWWRVRNLHLDQIHWLDFSQGNWANTKQEIDGQTYIWFDKNTIDSQLPDLLADTHIKQFPFTIRVVNTTETQGLGAQVARVITGMGGRVIEITNHQTPLDRCLLSPSLASRPSYLVTRLTQIFNCRINEQDLTDSRVDIELKIGKDQNLY